MPESYLERVVSKYGSQGTLHKRTGGTMDNDWGLIDESTISKTSVPFDYIPTLTRAQLRRIPEGRRNLADEIIAVPQSSPIKTANSNNIDTSPDHATLANGLTYVVQWIDDNQFAEHTTRLVGLGLISNKD